MLRKILSNNSINVNKRSIYYCLSKDTFKKFYPRVVIDKIYFDMGDYVRKNDKLMTIRTNDQVKNIYSSHNGRLLSVYCLEDLSFSTDSILFEISSEDNTNTFYIFRDGPLYSY